MVLDRSVRRHGMLEQYDKEVSDHIVASLKAQGGDRGALDSLSDRTYWNFRIWTDEDLAELIARGGRDANTRLAEIEMRRRESWQTPARWSLLVSLLALIVSIVALGVSLAVR